MESDAREKGSLALIPDHDIKSVQCIRSEKHLPPIGRESSIEKKQNENNNNNYHKAEIDSFKVYLLFIADGPRKEAAKNCFIKKHSATSLITEFILF
jgi:hypothetical protein